MIDRLGTDADEGPVLPPPPPEPIDLSAMTDLPPHLKPQSEEPPLAAGVVPAEFRGPAARPVVPFDPSRAGEPAPLPDELRGDAPGHMPYADEPVSRTTGWAGTCAAVKPGGCAGAIMLPTSTVTPVTFTTTSRKVSVEDYAPAPAGGEKARAKGVDTMECRPGDLTLPGTDAAKPY